ncbi:MAG TPA: hypothetical protein VGR03_14140 [Candidatus Acidoferrum sp.]|nr:hypothetical protein [Candidatus Acidoferrum sp.]
MKKLAALTLPLFFTLGTALADTPKEATPQATKAPQTAKPKAAAKKADKSAEIAAQLEELRGALQSQQEQIQQLRNDLAKRDQQIGEARDAAAAASVKAAEASSKAAEASNAAAQVSSVASALNSSVGEVKASNDALKAAVAEDQKAVKAVESPVAIRYKGVTLTPGGYLAAETVFHSHALGADINTPFASIPYPGNSLAKVSEINFTGRASRTSLLFEGKLEHVKLSGYYEADFLGVGTASNNRQSNSYVLRQRLAFAQAVFDSGWAVAGGQMWSLATENKKGLQNRQENLTMQVDPGYVVGFTWQRLYGLRVSKSWTDKFALGIAIEGPQTTFGGRGFNSYSNTSATGVVTAFQNFWLNVPGASGGVYNAFDATGYSANKAPDLIFKAALDPGWGHYELLGIVSTFRNRVYPCAVVGTNTLDTAPGTTTLNCAPDPTNPNPKPSALGAFNDTRTGGGVGASFNVPLFSKKIDFGMKAVGGDGIGRFGAAQLADTTARPDGTLALIRGEQALARIEFHATPKLDIYIYGGNEYAWRAAYTGYASVKITNTPAIPANGANPAYPATFKTTISQTGIGGYGSPFANNTGCSTETSPTGTSAPGAGGTCAGDIRNIMDFTLGFWHKLYQGPKGGVRWGIQYSYLTKSGWSGNNNTTTSVSPKAVDNMVWTSFRYYLP